MPSHNHNALTEYGIWGSNMTSPDENRYMQFAGVNSETIKEKNNLIKNSGSSQPHNNLQPYITVYMWKRTA